MSQDIRQTMEKLQVEIKQISDQQYSMSAQFNNLVSIVNQLSSQIQQNMSTVQQLQGIILNQQPPAQAQSPFNATPQHVLVQVPNPTPPPLSFSQTTTTPTGTTFLLPGNQQATPQQQQIVGLPNTWQPPSTTQFGPQFNQTQVVQSPAVIDQISSKLNNKHNLANKPKGMKRNRSFPELQDQANIVKAQMQQRNTVHGSYVALASLTANNVEGQGRSGILDVGGQQIAAATNPVVLPHNNQQTIYNEEVGMFNNMFASIFPELPPAQNQHIQQGGDVRDEVSGGGSLSSRESDGAVNDSSFVQQARNLNGRSKTTSGAMRIDGMKYHCGKDLTYTVIKRYFDRSLKQAAQDLGVCPTTLKRACRRIGIHRWPARQVRKMYKTISEYTHISETEKQKLRDQLDEQVKSHLEVHGQLACGVRLVENSFMEGSSLGDGAMAAGEEGTVSGGQQAIQNLSGVIVNSGNNNLLEQNDDHSNWVSNHINDLLQNGFTDPPALTNQHAQDEQPPKLQDTPNNQAPPQDQTNTSIIFG